MRMLRGALLAGVVLTGLCAPAAWGQVTDWTALVSDYYRDHYASNPIAATYAGMHAHDGEMGDFSAAAIRADITRLQDWLSRVEAVDATTLTPAQANDRDILLGNIRLELLNLEKIQGWRKDPSHYVGPIGGGLNALISRDFAPLPDRMEKVVARLEQVPALLAAGRANIVPAEVPPVFVEIARQYADGTVGFLRDDLTRSLAGVKDEKLQARFAKVRDAAVAAVEDYARFLTEIAPEAKGSYALGRENFQAMLAHAELIDTPVEKLLEVGYAQLLRDRKALEETAAEVDPAGLDAAMKALEAVYPSADQLIPMATGQLTSLQDFIRDKDILTLPFDRLPEVIETPPFARAWTLAALDSPGAFEDVATQSYYWITPPDAAWPEEKREEYLRAYNEPLMLNVSVHEAFPGHFVQGLYLAANPDWSMVRKASGSYANLEGWAHYTEQMMVEEGLGDAKLRMAQLIDALLRDCRYVAAIEMHVNGMSVEEAQRLFTDECRQAPVVAEMEANRGTQDPGYLSYTLGKLQILNLRDAVRRREGAEFSLGRFHDRFLNTGFVPVRISARELLGRDDPML